MKKTLKIILAVLAVGLVAAGMVGYSFYKRIYAPNIYVKQSKYLYIADNSDFNAVKDSLFSNFRVNDPDAFVWVAEKKNYPSKIRGGRYKITDGMSNNQIVNLLRSGNQEPVRVTFNNLRTIRQLCSKISHQLPIDSTYLYNLLTNDEFLRPYGFNSVTCNALFIPDTYEFYWNTSAEKFIERMYSFYKQYWTDERKAKAQKIGLTPLQVSILASIVQSEQAAHKEEQPIIAGLYLNRLKIDMPLQSCPTLIYAIGDFTIKRVTNKMTEIDSPYNTYKNPGLPPSPINFPEQSALNAVLNYQANDYIYMCAKSDFSGYHNFSKTYQQHLVYAKEYQKKLDQRGMWK
ncbi:MAG: endolytic transglycosylase MltG [Bacteroidales bacterium]|nr:endolytic transglycosylase MltG [Bacteroidales bacterium]